MKKIIFACLTAVLTLGLTNTASAALVYPVWVDASPTLHGGDGIADTSITLAPSEVVWLDVFISDIPTAGLVSAGLVVNYDPAQLEVTPGTWFYDPPWTADFNLSKISWDNNSGIIDFAGAGFGSPFGTVPLITIELHCIAPGVSSLVFGQHPGPIDDFVLANEPLSTILDADVLFPTIEMVNTPVPGALWLFGSGLVGLLGLRRKNRAG